MNKITDNQLRCIKALLDENRTAEALERLNEMIPLSPENDELLYLRGNAKRKKGDWSEAINDYLAAATINPSGPASEAAAILGDILAFRNKDLYNQ